MREVKVWVTEKNYELNITELCPWRYDEMVNGRVFGTLEDMNYTMLALTRGASRYAMEHGMACPRDTRVAIEKINALPKYK